MQATLEPEGGLKFHLACCDALLVGRLGSSVPFSSPTPPTPNHHLHLPPLSTVPPKEAAAEPHETLTPVQRMHSAHETLHSTNGYKCVFKEIPGF